uniref:Uncharacterized protein n=1 Tax=Anguilla anguilla TaxID=7936 RepID=A0A0E9Q7V6_ANGAN
MACFQKQDQVKNLVYGWTVNCCNVITRRPMV